MDFADATLVVLAEETGTEEILTLDLRGFHCFNDRLAILFFISTVSVISGYSDNRFSAVESVAVRRRSNKRSANTRE